MADEPDPPSPQERAYQRRFKDKGNKREDYAVDLFLEVLGNLDDLARVSRALLELGRFYNPLTDEPIVSVRIRQQVMEHLQGGRQEPARQLLVACLARYAPPWVFSEDPPPLDTASGPT